ncbi:MAG: type II restriction endonuclease [Schwartzia sp. (in: firmicutes)]
MNDVILDEFYEEMASVKFEAYGILDSSDKIHTLGTDSKIIGRIFEMFSQPVLESIAKNHHMILSTPNSQTVYPDFIMMRNEASKEKIAIDIKTTYVDSDQSTIKFTLGSFGSYMRNNTKNIAYQYTDYARHYVIGFVYKRNGQAQESHVFNYEGRNQIEFPFYGVKYFMQEKYKIAGDRPGSGNTENIGSFPTQNLLDLKNGNGPFCHLGVDVFDLYWKYYPQYRSSSKAYTSLREFMEWFPMQSKSNVTLLHPYDYNKVLNRIVAYAKKLSNR